MSVCGEGVRGGQWMALAEQRRARFKLNFFIPASAVHHSGYLCVREISCTSHEIFSVHKDFLDLCDEILSICCAFF